MKLNWNNDLRRVRVGPADAAVTFDALRDATLSTFPDLAPVADSLTLTYQDDDGDIVTVTSDVELAEALALCASVGRTLTLRVTAGTAPSHHAASRVAHSAADGVGAGTAATPSDAHVHVDATTSAIAVDDIKRLVALVREQVALDPGFGLQLSASVLAAPGAAALLPKVLAVLPDMARALEIVATDAATPGILALPVFAPLLPLAGIAIDVSTLPPQPPQQQQQQQPAFPSSGFPFPFPFPFPFSALSAGGIQSPSLSPLMTLLSQLNLGADPFSGVGNPHRHNDDTDSSSDSDSDTSSSSSDDERTRRVQRKAVKRAAKDEKKRKRRDDVAAAAAAAPTASRKLRRQGDEDRAGAGAGDAGAGAGDDASSTPAVHSTVTCDGCGVYPIVGVRYKCTVRDDFDLCAACEATGAFGPHAMLKIRSPDAAPAAVITLRREDVTSGSRGCGLRQLFVNAAQACNHDDGDSEDAATATAAAADWAQRRGDRCGGRRFWCRARGPCGVSAAGASGFDEQATATGDVDADTDLQAAIQASLIQASLAAAAAAATTTAATAPNGDAATATGSRDATGAYDAKFVADVTPSSSRGVAVTPGATVVKTWQLKNDGTAAWPSGTRLVSVGGATFGVAAEGVEVPAAAAGATVDVSLTLTAPEAAGRHVGYWRLATRDGTRFGHRVWADVYVATTSAADVVRALSSQPTALSVPVPVNATVAPAAATTLPGVGVVPDASVEAPARTTGTTGTDLAGRWDAQLIVLNEMGLYDVDANIAALEATRGNVARAVNRLFGTDVASS